MAENVIGSDVVVQVAIVVKDIEAKSAAWAKVLGVDVPKWSLTDGPEKSHIQYMGGPTEARAKLAFFRLGQVSLELIEPVGRPSTWGQFLDEKGEGIHHIAFNVKGMDGVIARLEANDISLVQRGDYTGGCYAYMDGAASLGAILELLESFR
jgi:methylmalonyl-CoA/ethylmalonyl-CoA epimerase